MANGDVIKQVREMLEAPDEITIKAGLKMTLTLLLELRENWETDHKRMLVLWPAYEWGKWIALLIVALGVTDVITRILSAAAK